MSTENNDTVVSNDVTSDLDTFSDELFGRSSPAPEAATSDEVDETEADDASNDDTQTETDTLNETDENTSEEGDVDKEPADTPKKKNRFQERIDELTAGKREAERKAQELSDRLAKLEAKEDVASKVDPLIAAGEPTPDDKNEDGSDKYPLGEIDPRFLKDLAKFAIAEEREAYKAKDQEAAEQARIQEERLALQATWEDKLSPAQERYPDFMEKSTTFVDTYSDLDPAYGEYLSAQIMDLDYGPDVLYYLANNPDEAQKIVESGARKATVALGRLDAKFSFADEEKQKARLKVSNAPIPPPTNKGAAAARIAVPADTDDLDAFTRELFRKR